MPGLPGMTDNKRRHPCRHHLHLSGIVTRMGRNSHAGSVELADEEASAIEPARTASVIRLEFKYKSERLKFRLLPLHVRVHCFCHLRNDLRKAPSMIQGIISEMIPAIEVDALLVDQVIDHSRQPCSSSSHQWRDTAFSSLCVDQMRVFRQLRIDTTEIIIERTFNNVIISTVYCYSVTRHNSVCWDGHQILSPRVFIK